MEKTPQTTDQLPSAPRLTLAGHSFALRWDMRTLYRLQGLDNPPELDRLFSDQRRNLRTTLDLLWAALPEAAPYATPEALATALGTGPERLAELAETLSALLATATPDEEKKSEPSSSPTPASSLA